jgi:Amt family ammonium transporter
VAGLVAITPCAGFVSVSGALVIGLLAGVGCAFAISLKNRLGYDDSLDVVGVHFVGGWIGTLSVGFFSTDVTNSLANNGVFYGGGGKYGGWNLLLHQAEAAAVVTVFSFVGTFVIAKVIGLVMKTRVTEEAEVTGLDQSIHGETAYDFGTLTGSGGGGNYSPATAALTKERVQA